MKYFRCRIAQGITGFASLTLQTRSAVDGICVSGDETIKLDMFALYLRQLFLQHVLNFVTMLRSRLVAKVQQEPEFEARVGHRQAKAICPCHFPCLWDLIVLIAVEYAPDFIVREIFVTLSPSVFIRSLLLVPSKGYQSRGNPSRRTNSNLNERIAAGCSSHRDARTRRVLGDFGVISTTLART